MVKSMQECFMSRGGAEWKVSLSETASFSTIKAVTKEASHRGLESNWAGLALLSESKALQRANRGKCLATCIPICQCEKDSVKGCFQLLSDNFSYRFLQVLALPLSQAKHVCKVLEEAAARTCLERKKKDSILLECCSASRLLEGISNWINNCLIPFSQLDLSAQTEEAVSYGKDT